MKTTKILHKRFNGHLNPDDLQLNSRVHSNERVTHA